MGALLTFAGLLVLGFIVGKALEGKHLRSINRREDEARTFQVNSLKHPPEGAQVTDAFLCSGSVVIASDYYKTFASGLKSLVGGQLRSFETLLERARREAVLRMSADAKRRGADMVINTRIETATIGRGAGRSGLASSEIVAYGTGLRLTNPA